MAVPLSGLRSSAPVQPLLQVRSQLFSLSAATFAQQAQDALVTVCSSLPSEIRMEKETLKESQLGDRMPVTKRFGLQP